MILHRFPLPAVLFSLVILLSGCGDDETFIELPEGTTEAQLCDSLVELTRAAGYILYEASGCPTTEGITASELLVEGDDQVTVYSLPFTFPFMGADYSEVTLGTNGFIFMAADTNLTPYVLELPTGNWADGIASAATGVPFVAAWNVDLNSAFCGPANPSPTCEATRVQSFTEPNRVLVDWHTETFEEGGSGLNNHLQAWLFETGEVVLVYDFFDTVDPDGTLCPGETYCVYDGDFGSGVTLADGTTYHSLSDAIGGPVWQQPGMVYAFVPEANE